MGLYVLKSKSRKVTDQFCRDESGGMMIFVLIMFLTMTVFGGLAVDIANHAQRRTTYQTHLDNAVLAAASLSQQLNPEEVVFSYMSSAGLDRSMVNVETSEENIGSILVGRTVYASLSGGVNTYFFNGVARMKSSNNHLEHFRSTEEGSQTIPFVIMVPLLVWSIVAMLTFTDAFRARAIVK